MSHTVFLVFSGCPATLDQGPQLTL